MAVQGHEFRSLFGVVPTAVSVVTTLDDRAVPRGMTCSAVAAVSLAPPLLLICVDRNARTLPWLRGHAAFVVNFLAAGREHLSDRFAGKEEDKFDAVRWTPGTATRGAPVLLDDVIAYAECRLAETVEAGDHWVLIGRVEAVAVFDRPPLIYHRRSYPPWPAIPVGLGSSAVRAE